MRVTALPQAFRRYAGHTTVVTIGGEQFRLTAGRGAGGLLGDVAISCGRHGSSAAGLLESYAAAISIGLGHGVPLTDLLRPGLGLRFPPDGRTDDPEIPHAFSAVDYCCRRLAIDWLPWSERAALGIGSPAMSRAGTRDGTRAGTRDDASGQSNNARSIESASAW
jgi:ribonucleoside-diphosphate reductase alpha chain